MPDSRFEVRFTVLEPMRGDPGPEVVVASSDRGGMCGVNFSVGANYVVYASENPDLHLWWTGICMRTHVVADPARDEDLQWFHVLPNVPGTGTIYGKVRDFMGRNPDSPGKVGPLPQTKITLSGPDSRTTIANDFHRRFPSRRSHARRIRGLRYSSAGLSPNPLRYRFH